MCHAFFDNHCQQSDRILVVMSGELRYKAMHGKNTKTAVWKL